MNLEKFKFWKRFIFVEEEEKEEEPEKKTKLQRIDDEIDAVIGSAVGLTPGNEAYSEVLNNLDRLYDLRDREAEIEKKEPNGVLKFISNLIGKISDPRVIAAAIASSVYVWWGKTVIEYDSDGNIVPTKLHSQGPKAPKVQ